MGSFRFVTEWQIDAPIESIWEQLIHAEDWPSWWKGVEKVVLLDRGGENGIGDRRQFTWKSRLPYRLVFEMTATRSERPHLLEGHATGELEGLGTWTLAERDGGTRMRYVWAVRTTRPWMNLPLPFARRIFEVNHDAVMRWGGQGLARRLNANLMDLTTEVRAGGGASGT
jgi:uncharacterized protein YndB with AHSA1/START domain